MRFDSILISSCLLASLSLASLPRSLQQNLIQKSANTFDGVVYNEGFGGLVWQLESEILHSVAGVVTMPRISGPVNASTTVAVGIDGMVCPGSSAIFQVGVNAVVTSNGTNYKAWFQSTSHNETDDSFTISANDTIQFKVLAWNNVSGFAEITNLNTGQYAYRKLQSSEPLCRHQAYCGIETMWINNDTVMLPFPDFGLITFTDVAVTNASGQTHGLQGVAMTYGIQVNGTILTSVSNVDDSSFTIEYV